MPPAVRVTRRGADRVRAGHPWIYRSDVATSDAAPGDFVRVLTDRGRPIGWAFWSQVSQIALRLVSTETSATPPDEHAFFVDRIRKAIHYRTTLDIDATAYRLVHGEADRLPGLIVDRYADDSNVYLVVQALSQAVD